MPRDPSCSRIRRANLGSARCRWSRTTQILKMTAQFHELVGLCSTRATDLLLSQSGPKCAESRSLISHPPRRHGSIPSRFASCCCVICADVAVFSILVAIIAQRAHEWEFRAGGASLCRQPRHGMSGSRWDGDDQHVRARFGFGTGSDTNRRTRRRSRCGWL